MVVDFAPQHSLLMVKNTYSVINCPLTGARMKGLEHR